MSTPPIILLVDDNPDVLDVLEDELNDLGYQVRRATDGQAALAHLDATVMAAVVDLRMPPPDGWRVLEALAQRVPPVPAIVLSGLPLWPEARQQLAALGVVAVLTKPLDRLETFRGALRLALQPPSPWPTPDRPIGQVGAL
jgi:CheY-like chemotaxis protein